MEKEELTRLLQEIIKEGEKGQIVVDTENNSMVYNARFFVLAEGKSNVKNSTCPTIIIKNKEEFIAKLKKYLEKAVDFYKKDQDYFLLNDKDFNKLLITCLIINAGLGDFNDFNRYVDARTNALYAPIEEEIKKLKTNGSVSLYSETKKLRPNLEGLYKDSFYFDGEELGRFVLPSITYSCVNDAAVVYAVQGVKGKQKTKLANKIDRYLRGLNSGIEDEDYIKEVSPNAVASFILFAEKMKKAGYKTIIGEPYMPLRYQAKHNQTYIKGNKKQLLKEDIKNEQDFNDYLQFNITNKLGYLFPRYAHHFPSSSVVFDDINEKVILHLSQENKKENNIAANLTELI